MASMAKALPDYLTTAEVAEILRCSTETVLRAIRRGDLEAVGSTGACA